MSNKVLLFKKKTNRMVVRELKITTWWQLRKAMIFYGNEHIVIDFDGNQQILSNVKGINTTLPYSWEFRLHYFFSLLMNSVFRTVCWWTQFLNISKIKCWWSKQTYSNDWKNHIAILCVLLKHTWGSASSMSHQLNCKSCRPLVLLVLYDACLS
jgi:hypothetical protein